MVKEKCVKGGMRTRQEAVCHSRERCWGQRKQGGMDRGQAKLSLVTQLYLTLYDPMDCSLPSSSVHGTLQAEYWRELPFPSPGDLPNAGMEPRSPTWQADSLSSELPGIQAELLCKKRFHMVTYFFLRGQCFRYLETSWPVR